MRPNRELLLREGSWREGVLRVIEEPILMTPSRLVNCSSTKSVFAAVTVTSMFYHRFKFLLNWVLAGVLMSRPPWCWVPSLKRKKKVLLKKRKSFNPTANFVLPKSLRFQFSIFKRLLTPCLKPLFLFEINVGKWMKAENIFQQFVENVKNVAQIQLKYNIFIKIQILFTFQVVNWG